MRQETGIRHRGAQSEESGVRGQGGGRHSLMEDPLAPTVTLDLNLPARIPESYVPEAALRLQLYRRLAGLTALDAVDELAQEFADRFGPVPEEVGNLLLRGAGQSAGGQRGRGSHRHRGRPTADQERGAGNDWIAPHFRTG